MHIAYSWIFFYLVWKFLFLTGTFSPFVLNLIVNIFEFIYVFSATTKYQTGWLLNNRHFFLTILVAGKSKTKVLADLVPGESLCSGLTMFAFSLCLHMAERVGSGLSSSFCMCACPVAQSCLTLCDPWTVACQFPVHGLLQARIVEWVAISYSRGSSQPRDQTHVSCVSCIGRWMLYHCTIWEAPSSSMRTLIPLWGSHLHDFI